MKMIFLDLEWNSHNPYVTDKDELIEIGATIITSDNEAASYFRLIRCEHYIPKRTFRFLHINSKMLIDKGIYASVAMQELVHIMGEDYKLIVWSKNTKDMLKTTLERTGYSKDLDDVVIIQDLIVKINNTGVQISFENALNMYGISYNPACIHNAQYDSERLRELYYTAVNDKDALKTYESANIHTQNTIKTIRNLKGKAVSEDEIKAILDFFKCRYEIKKACLYITTEYTSWRVYIKDGYAISLKHENYERGYGYHDHELLNTDLYSVIEYICHHDIAPRKNTKKINDIDRKERAKARLKERQKQRRTMNDEIHIKRSGKYWDYSNDQTVE